MYIQGHKATQQLYAFHFKLYIYLDFPKSPARDLKKQMVRRSYIFILPIFFIIDILSAPAFASDLLFYKELDLIGGFSRQDGWTGKTDALSNSIGFESYGKFSSDYGDYLTTDLQARFAYDASRKFDDACSVELHNAWAECRMDSAAKLKAGHFEPAFGLEQVIDAHSTILQTMAMEDIGYTKDWGLGLRGSLAGFDYWTAIQLGSGMSIRRIDSSYLFSARVGTPSGRDFQYGVSGSIASITGVHSSLKACLLALNFG